MLDGASAAVLAVFLPPPRAKLLIDLGLKRYFTSSVYPFRKIKTKEIISP